jgi:hypothetical protein
VRFLVKILAILKELANVYTVARNFGPKHVGVGVFYIILVNLMQLCSFVGVNYSGS